MAKIQLDRDAYGRRGQLSLMADFFELFCSTEKLRLTHTVIADYLRDRGIRIPRFESVVIDDFDDELTSGELDDEAPIDDHVSETEAGFRNANEDATRVLNLIRERENYLGEAYPFRLRDGTTIVRITRAIVAYDVALSLALRHAFVKDRNAPTDFEEFVARCLKSGHWRVFPFGARVIATNGSGAPRFRKVFKELARDLCIRARRGLVVPKRVHDRGVDVVARWEPIDDRPGCHTVLVQCTVGQAHTWAGKAADTPRGAWRELLGDPLEPLVALALPHHVEREQLHDLVENGNGATVLDRLRLVSHQPRVTAADRNHVRSLRADGVEW